MHGVYDYDDSTPEKSLRDLIYRGSAEQLAPLARKSDRQVPVLLGLLFFCPQTAEKLLMLQVVPPLNACTFMGLDEGAEPFSMSLFLDIVYCLVHLDT